MTESSWKGEHMLETPASPEAIWSAWSDVGSWKQWNAGIERVELEGPFATGTWFTMQPPGQDPMRSRFLEVEKNRGFVDETRVGDLVVRVAHRLETPTAGRTRIVYSVTAIGSGAAEIGPAISADFPEVLAALAAFVEASRA